MRVAIIGGGAAGYFAAINICEMSQGCEVTIFEAASQSLRKVGISGGGRCNLTNSFAAVSNLKSVYPRGSKLIQSCFREFDQRSTVEWFESRGVALTTQEDECLFPVSQSSQQIIDLFTQRAAALNITVKHSHKVSLIRAIDEGGYEIHFEDEKLRAATFDRVVVTVGGSPSIEGFEMLRELSLSLESPIPSLFTFNIPNNPITTLMGCVVEGVELTYVGSKRLTANGTLLITHWGFSGPAVLRLSSYAARALHEEDYKAEIAVNWIGERNTERVLEQLRQHISEHGAKLVTSRNPFALPSRIWMALLIKSGISHERRFAELGSKGLNRLVESLTNDRYQISGQSRFREEFVTCGGVALSSIDIKTCEARNHKGLYFAGEILDVDGVTGGFNLQAAWSTGYCVALAIGSESGSLSESKSGSKSES